METDKVRPIPLFVDMDGTLVKTDIALELLLQACKSLRSVKALFRLTFSGRSHIKHYLARHTAFSPEHLPYSIEVIDYIKAEKDKGRQVILATATDSHIAHQVADHLGLFDEVIASEPGRNLKGKHKLAAIQQYELSGDGFEYIGDAKADYPIWQEAERCGFVNPPKQPQDIISDPAAVSLHVENKADTFKALLKAMRPHQWAKNLLIFVPLFFSHHYVNLQEVFAVLLTFVAFSFCASGVYLINDLLDIEADRQHLSKKNRPFAAGNLSPSTGVIASIFLITFALAVCAVFLNGYTLLMLLAYVVITNLYSFYLKHYSTIDVITLTILYTLRIITGAAAIAVALSPWLLNFSIFFFLSLAYMKRYIELSKLKQSGKTYARGYTVDDQDIVLMTGLVNAGVAVFTLTLYLNSEYVLATYASPMVLWLVCPLMLFWIYRAWMWTKRDKIDDDPVVFAIKDRISLLTALITGFLVVFSRYVDVRMFSL